jgi:lysophospholipase L1-like esterase
MGRDVRRAGGAVTVGAMALAEAGLFTVLLMTCAASGAGLPAASERSAAGRAQPATFLALGDSYTIGQGVTAPERWPERLVALLAARGVTVAPPRVLARTGWTTADLDRAMAAEQPKGAFDLVSLMIGVNDQFQGQSVDSYERRFTALLAQAVALAGGEPRRVLVLSIPDYGVTPFARRLGLDGREVAAEVDHFNAAARLAVQRAGARWVDVTPASRRAAADVELVARDGLHPSGKLHAEWAALAMPAALEALAARR